MVKKNWLLVLEGVMVVLIVGLGFLLKWNIEKVGWEKIEEVFPDRGLPRMNITLNGVSLEEIDGGSKDIKYEGNGLTIYDGRSEVKEFGGVQMKGRGNTTWGQEKKPYQIRFGDKEELFGMGRARKWVLLANALDATNLRTETAFYLEEMLGMTPAFTGEFVELYVDGDYRGLYYLTHAVEIDKQSVNLKDAMGVLVELDNMYGLIEDYRESGNGDKLVVKDVVDVDRREEAMELFMKDYNELEEAIKEGDYKKAEEFANLTSLAQYYLLSEFTVNPDAYWTSFYFYKNGVGDKIHAGPGWDFDLAFANKVWRNWLGDVFHSSRETMVRKKELQTKEFYDEMGIEWYDMSQKITSIEFDLMEMPEFQNLVQQVYRDRMMGREDELIWQIEQKANKIEEAVMADEKRWGNDGFWQEVETMKQWISERYKYFEEVYGGERILID
ncbi:MAG: CotH kinase family protein [Candidatus Saccharibacteria bacterium]|nr:CotH kinase family protein [Candidatus Saccharibacteria bacterium]